jgi:uncharacterized protein
MKKYFLSLFFSIILFTNTVFALTPMENFYVNDYVGLLSAEQRNDLIGRAELLYSLNGVQVVTVIVDNYIGNDSNAFALQIFNSFGVGTAGYDNGVLLFVATNDGVVEIITGDGFSSYLPDSAAGRLLDDTFMPKALSDDLDGAVVSTFIELITIGSRITTPAPTVVNDLDSTVDNLLAAQHTNQSMQNSGGFFYNFYNFIWFVLFLFLLGAIGGGSRRRRRGGSFLPTMLLLNRRSRRRHNSAMRNTPPPRAYKPPTTSSKSSSGRSVGGRSSGGGGRSRGGGTGRKF